MGNKNSYKTCKKCKSNLIKKDGFMKSKQRYLGAPGGYKCKLCSHVFQNKSR